MSQPMNAPAFAAAPVPPPLTRRIDEVGEQLTFASDAISDLVRCLEPVLPPGFQQTTVPAAAPTRPPVDSSPLASALDQLASHGENVVRRLRDVLNAVDL